VAVTYAEVATGGTRAAQLEGVIVSLGASSISAVAAPEYTVTAGSAMLVVSNFLYTTPNPTVDQPITRLTGILSMRGMASRLQPRGAGEIVAGPPVLATFGPSPQFTRVGASGPTFPAPLAVTLTGSAQGATFVTVTSNNAAVTVVGGGVTVPDGASSA